MEKERVDNMVKYLGTIEHTGITIILAVLSWLLTGNPIWGALAGAGIFIGREHAQAEYRWIENYGNGKRANMPWYGGFSVKAWDTKSVLDALLPIMAAAIVAIFIR